MKTLIVGLLAAVSLLGACTQAPHVGARSSGSLAASTDDALLYAADTDNGLLGVIDVKTQKTIAEVKVGQSPWRVTVAPDDTIFVANRGSRSVSVIRRGDWTVAAELATDIDPVGMVMTPDGKTLYVVCATSALASEYGTLTAFDVATLTPRWTLNVGAEPRGIALVSENRAVVSLYMEGEVVEVDLAAGALVKKNRGSLYQAANRSALTSGVDNTGKIGGGGLGPVTFHPRAASDLVAVPGGGRVFVLGSLSRETPILTPPSTFTPYYKAQGPGLAGSVTTSAIFTLDTTNGGLSPQVDDVSGFGRGTDNQAPYPQTSFAASGSSRAVLQGPTVGVTDYTGEWLYVVNRETNTLALISANKRVARETEGPCQYCQIDDQASLHSFAAVGSGSDGVVVMGDNLTAFVYSQFEHKVYRVAYDTSSRMISASGPIATVGVEQLTPALAAGRKLFFDANDRRVSAVEASVACSSCHLEGRDDGHTWNFPDGPRQTPTLAGRGILETAPFHWSGEFPGLNEFLTHTITARMGGTGIDPEASTSLNQYMGAIPVPENAYLKGELTAEQVRGQHVFAKAQCGSCHSGRWFTNNVNVAVGTLAPRDNGLVVKNGLNVPSLKGLARSGPYLHDGSVATLSERILKNPDDRHGVTSTLNAAEVADLVSYLRAL